MDDLVDVAFLNVFRHHTSPVGMLAAAEPSPGNQSIPFGNHREFMNGAGFYIA
jgi:hypothetical protein